VLKGYDYPFPDLPYEFKPFEEMTPAEAQEHLDWFVRMSGARRELLIRAFHATGGKGKLDYGPDSLVPLWKWAMPWMEEVKPTADELARILEAEPAWVRKAEIEFGELTSGAKCVCMDIGFYIAEIFIESYEGIEWAWWPKKTGPYNRPYLTGFRAPFVPSDLVAGCAWSVVKRTGSPKSLREGFDVWAQDLE
jgi:hypothetical protein